MHKYENIKEIIEKTDGFINKHLETKFLFEMANLLEEDNNILEIGSYKGLSSICLGYGLKNNKNIVFCIDVWPTNNTFIDWRKNVSDSGLKNIVPIIGDANKILKNVDFCENIGLIFIDSSHSYYDCKIQFELSTKNLKKNCFIIFHDYGHPSYPDVKRFCDELENCNKLFNIKKIGLMFCGTTNS